jgi:DNA-binding GntR family transcriptional regulator
MTLLDRILADLRHRLSTGEAPDLRLQVLAARYGSSTRPVRLALAQLAADGVISRVGGRGWRIVRRPRRTAPPGPSEDPRARVLDHIIRRSLAGDGSFLREAETAARLAITRTTLRSQLGMLAGRGVVIHEPRRGWRARTFTQADFDAFLQVRERLELLALELALPHVEDARIQAFLAANRPEADGIDNDLHGYLMGLAGNPYIDDFFTRHGTYFAMLFQWEGQHAAAAAAARAQHRAVLAAILVRDLAAARAALSLHIRGQHPVLASMVRPA